MSTFDNPFDTDRKAAKRCGCSCGEHPTQAEHDAAATRAAARPVAWTRPAKTRACVAWSKRV